MAGEYFISWSDPAKPDFVVDPQTSNETTSITIVGKGFENYGEIMQENTLHLLENFAAPTPPSAVVEGQLWFDTSSTTMKLYDGDKFIVVGSHATASSVAPSLPEVGDLWYNVIDETLYIYSGSSWDAAAKKSDLDAHTGDSTAHLTAAEKLFVENNSASTVVASELNNVVGTTSNIQTQLNNRVSKSGSTMTGYLTLHDNPVDDFHSAPKGYVDSSVFALAAAIYAGDVQYVYNDIYTTYLGAATTIIPLPFSYDIGSHVIQVFVSGVKMTEGFEFTETLVNQIDLSDPAPADTEVTVFHTLLNPPVQGTTPSNSSLLRILEWRQISGVAQSVFTRGAMSDVGTNGVDIDWNSALSTVMVYVNGIKQNATPGQVYTITGVDEITFTDPVPDGAVVNVVQYVENSGGTVDPNIEYESFTAILENTAVIELSTPYHYDINSPLDPDNTATMVFINGVFQGQDAYQETNGFNIVLSEGIGPGDQIEIYKFKLVEDVVA